MQIIYDIKTIRHVIKQLKLEQVSIGFVPTMGALHKGHLALIKQAQKMCDIVIVSIFVNKKQFNDEQDYINYPIEIEQDIKLLAKEKVSYLFCPTSEEIWPEGVKTIVETTKLSDILIGKVRPGHFRGVTTIVVKLFNLIEPNYAFFGEKDFQQLTIIKQMVEDLNFNIEIIGVPIIREEDGVAYSSRNKLLKPNERMAAKILYQSLKAAQHEFTNGMRSVKELQNFLKHFIEKEKLAKIEVIDILEAKTLMTAKDCLKPGMVILLFVRFGTVQLLDQYILR